MAKLARGLATLLAVATVACARDWSDPRAVLLRHLEAVYADDLDEAYAHLCDDDHASRTLDAYVARDSTGDSVIVRELARRAKFEVVSLEVAGDRARATVRITQPDMSRGIGIAMERGLGGDSSFEDAADAALDAPLPMVTVEKRFALVRQADGWRVRLNWRHETEIYTYLTAAQNLESAGQKAEAVEVYRQALALDDALFEVERKIADLEEELAESEEGAAEAESEDSGWEAEWEAESAELEDEAAAIDSAYEEAAEDRAAPDAELGRRSAEHALRRAEHDRELLRQLAREDIEAQGGDPDLVDRAEQVPFDEAR
jgi:hypothetical protein